MVETARSRLDHDWRSSAETRARRRGLHRVSCTSSNWRLSVSFACDKIRAAHIPEVQMQDSLGKSPSQDSPRRSWTVVILVALAVALVGIGFDRLLVREGVSRYDLLAI